MFSSADIRAEFFHELEAVRAELGASTVVVYRKDKPGGYSPLFVLPECSEVMPPFVASASDLASYLRVHGDEPFQMECDTFADTMVHRSLVAFGASYLMVAPFSTETGIRYYLSVGSARELGTRERDRVVASADKLSELLAFNAMRVMSDVEVLPDAAGASAERPGTPGLALMHTAIRTKSFSAVATQAFGMLPDGVRGILVEDVNGRLLASAPGEFEAPRSLEWLSDFSRLPFLDALESGFLPVAIPPSACGGDDAHLIVPLTTTSRLVGLATILGDFDPADREFAETVECLAFACCYLLCRREASRGHILDKLLNSVENERMRLACELHDETSQNLVALKVRLSTVERALECGRVDDAAGIAEDCVQIADCILSGVNRLSGALRSSELNYLGFCQAIEASAHARLDHVGIPFELTGNAVDVRFNPLQETMLLSGLDEALSNCAKHSGASRVSITMEDDGSWFTIAVRDDGAGFNAPARIGGDASYGLRSMSNCARAIGGDFWIASTPGRGTRVRFSVPNQVLEEHANE